MVEIFHTPEVGAVNGNEGAKEKIGIKQGSLSPETVPQGVQDIHILQVICTPHYGADQGENEENHPDKRAFQFHKFGAHTGKQHIKPPFS